MPMTRDEHMAWAKGRALEYLNTGDVQNAITSMLSDLGKHPETEGAGRAMAPVAMMTMMNQDPHEARRFIEGFR